MTKPEKTEYQWKAAADRLFLIALACHLPVLALAAYLFGSSLALALGAGLLIVAGPAAAYASAPGSRFCNVMLGIATMGMSALLIHLGHGMIEMHFHIFVGIAALIVLGDSWAILAAAGTAAVHHILFWLIAPASVFNYQAGFGIVLLHALFVIVETIPACYIAGIFEHARNSEAITAAQLPEASKAVSSATDAAAGLASELNAYAGRQHAAASSASAAVGEISDVATRNTEDSARAAATIEDLFDRRLSAAEQSARSMLATMSDIQTSSGKIKGILSIIENIAFQTNILALNAAVEAARAGDAGKGFNVVADEVRSLAQRCAAAARDTSQLIEQSVATSQSGNVHMHKLGSQIAGIAEKASGFRQLFEGIRQGSREQSENIGRVLEAHRELEDMAGHIANIARDSAASGASLREQAGVLSEMIAALR